MFYQERIRIKIKKTSKDAVIPMRANDTDSGYDLVAIDDGVVSSDGEYIEYDTGLQIQPAQGFFTTIRPRSSITKYDLILKNSLGTIDESYTGNLKLRFALSGRHADLNGNHHTYSVKTYKKGDKIGQLVVERRIDADFDEVDSLEKTERGEGGFGSSGN